MAKWKTHYDVVVQEPNESDTLGYTVSLCGREYYEKGTDHKPSVTCKRCIAQLKGRE